MYFTIKINDYYWVVEESPGAGVEISNSIADLRSCYEPTLCEMYLLQGWV
jgi:hypothetical protein